MCLESSLAKRFHVDHHDRLRAPGRAIARRGGGHEGVCHESRLVRRTTAREPPRVDHRQLDRASTTRARANASARATAEGDRSSTPPRARANASTRAGARGDDAVKRVADVGA